MGWADVTGWVAQGGAILGTKRTLPKSRMAQVAARLAEFKIHGLLIIGGFEVSSHSEIKYFHYYPMHFFLNTDKLPVFGMHGFFLTKLTQQFVAYLLF